MGKKSKRSRSSSTKATPAPRSAPALRNKPEINEDLEFEDDDIEEWEDEDDANQPNGDGDEDEDGERVQSWHPLLATPGDENVELEMDPSAYKMHHALQLEWPALSFDFLRDPWGDARTRFPHSVLVAVGTQADIPKRNSIEILKLSELAKIRVETEDDILGEEYNPDEPDDNDDDNMDSDDEEDDDKEPLMERISIKHFGGVNRLRTMPHNTAGTSSSIIATWSDVGKVFLYNVDSVVESLTSTEETKATPSSSSLSPFFIHSGHETEGYALDWSKQQQQQCQLATGDCSGQIHLWAPRPEGGYQVTPTYEALHDGQPLSVEDIQWSPTEATVLAASTVGGFCQIYDTRAPHRAMLSHILSKTSNKSNHAASSSELGPDLNVLSWNSLVSNLLATGSDSGELCVWDLRQFSSSATQKMAPLARFDSHRSPISSVEWHPTDESMLAATDDRGTYVYDFSVEPDRSDDDNTALQQQGEGVLPPQLLFTHCGSTQFKEVHWHAQITSCLMTTALSGLSVFIPCNL